MHIRVLGRAVRWWWRGASRWERTHALATLHVGLFFGLYFGFQGRLPLWVKILVAAWPLQGTLAVVWASVNRRTADDALAILGPTIRKAVKDIETPQ